MLIPSIIASIGLSAATLETILFHHAMTTKLPSDKINYHNVFKQYFQKSPTGLDGEVTIVRWDVGVVFLLFWSLAAWAFLVRPSPATTAGDPTSILLDVIVLIFSSAYVSFISRYLFHTRGDFKDLLISIFIGFALVSVRVFMSMQAYFFVIAWTMAVVILTFYLWGVVSKELSTLNDIGYVKDFICLSLIFFLTSLAYSRLEDIIRWGKIPTHNVSLGIGIVGVVIVSLIALLADIYSPYWPEARATDLCRRILHLHSIESTEERVKELKNVWHYHAWIRSFIFLFVMVVVPFIFAIFYSLFATA